MPFLLLRSTSTGNPRHSPCSSVCLLAGAFLESRRKQKYKNKPQPFVGPLATYNSSLLHMLAHASAAKLLASGTCVRILLKTGVACHTGRTTTVKRLLAGAFFESRRKQKYKKKPQPFVGPLATYCCTCLPTPLQPSFLQAARA